MGFAFADRFPADISFGVRGGPEYLTRIIQMAGGREKRLLAWNYPLSRFDVSHSIKTKDQLEQLLNYYQSHKGKIYGFRFKDWLDYQAVNQMIGTGDGSTTRYQLVKTYTIGICSESRNIYLLVPDTLTPYVDGIELTKGFVEVLQGGLIWFVNPPTNGQVLTADYEFDVPVRFDVTRMESLIKAPEIYDWKNIQLYEIRPPKSIEIETDWAQDYKFNWTFDNMGGCKLTETVAGLYDGATATPYLDGADWKVKIESPLPGPGTVQLVRGVYLDSVEFGWSGFWADPLTVATNYYDSFENYETYTEITLTGDPGGDVQIYYIYRTGETSEKYDGLNNWPTVKSWKDGNSYTIVNAVDKFHELICTLFRETASRGVDNYELMSLLWDYYKNHSPVRTPPLALDNFEREVFEAMPLSVYRNGTDGTVTPFTEMDIVSENGNRYLKFAISLPDNNDSAWYGYMLEITGMSNSPWNTMTKCTLSLRCYDQGPRLFLQINNATSADEDKYTNPEYIFWHAIPDRFEDWTDFEISFANFWRRRNIYDDRDRVRGTWWSSGNITDAGDHAETITVADEVFYTARKFTLGDSGWGNFGVGSAGDNRADPTNMDKLQFLLKIETAGSQNIEVQVLQDGDSSPRTYTILAADISSEWKRFSIPFANFTPAIDNTKSITWIQWQYNTLPGTGTAYITDVIFGDHETYADLKTNLLLFQFYVEQQGITSHRYDLDDISFGLNVADPYPYIPTWGNSQHEYGDAAYNGPGFVHYSHPLAPHLLLDTVVRDTHINFVADSQNAFNIAYGGTKGPVIPVHTRNFMENIPLLGSDNFNSFCWWSDYPEIGNGYAQYWTFSKIAEYYYFTEDSSVIALLNNWVNWLNTYLVEDETYPDPPKGYKMPTNFNGGSITYGTYNPYFAAAIAKGLLYYYWITGDSDCNIWIRHLLDDLRVNRWDNSYGGYIGEGSHQAHGNGRILKLFGMVVAGRYNHFGNYDFIAIPEDATHLDTLASWMLNNAGDSKPNVLNADLIPFGHAENSDSWDYAPNYIYPRQMSTMEALTVMLGGVLEYSRVKGDWAWFDTIREFILTRIGGWQ